MAKKRKKKRNKKPGQEGCGIGAHNEVSPMGHGTRTKTKQEREEQIDRKRKQDNWGDN